MDKAPDERIDIFLNNNTRSVERMRKSRKTRLLFALSPRLSRLYSDCLAEASHDEKNAAFAAVLNAYEESVIWRARALLRCAIEDVRVLKQQRGKRTVIDNSDRDSSDYYSVAVIVKNEGRYLKEFILFYMATGADRIYLYDNDSEDDTFDVIKPFVDSGYVIYKKWPGKVVQTAAYRDAIRYTKKRTKWLALIDADEFLFSPKGPMPDQLKKYEDYPGIGVNWLMFGPNGHMERPEGLVMDNYTTTIAEYNTGINCHIKSIVQPRNVFCVFHTHYAIYRGRAYAVDERGVAVDNFSSFLEKTGRAFTSINNRTIFRINHYNTKSLEELRAKCRRGFADGAPNAVFEELLRAYDEPLTEDHAIKRYAETVRKVYKNY